MYLIGLLHGYSFFFRIVSSFNTVRERETDRQTDRQTETARDRDRETETERQRQTETERGRQRETDRQTQRHTEGFVSKVHALNSDTISAY